jgi:flagellar basal body-associated protein FliL
MSTSDDLSTSQKGGIVILVFVVVVILGLLLGAYFLFNDKISSKTQNPQTAVTETTKQALQASPIPSAEVIYQNRLDTF